jgi:hypothetical protein
MNAEVALAKRTEPNPFAQNGPERGLSLPRLRGRDRVGAQNEPERVSCGGGFQTRPYLITIFQNEPERSPPPCVKPPSGTHLPPPP